MKYIELTVHTTSEASELVSDVMWEYTDLGVTVCDYNDVLALQRDSTVFWDYMDESVEKPRADVLVKCYFSPEEANEKIPAVMREIRERQTLCGGEINFGTLEETKRGIEGDDWIEVWKKHFRPIRIGNIVIVPEWIPYDKQDNEQIVTLDSNMAFGTGEHETTRMCIELLQKYMKEGDVVLDVGCGSGILGISAAKLGAKFCYLSDLDPIAVESSKHNALINGVSQNVAVSQANLLDASGVKADLLLANITAEVLILLAPAVPAALKDGGKVILSGILPDRLDAVETAFGKGNLRSVEQRRMGEWMSIVLER